MTKHSLNTLPQELNQSDVTDCDDINCHICHPKEELKTLYDGRPYTNELHQILDKQQTKNTDLTIEAHKQINKIALVLRNMHIGR
jgi:Zn-finger protein